MELLLILLVLFVALPSLGVVIPDPLNRILGILLFVILFYWLLTYLHIR